MSEVRIAKQAQAVELMAVGGHTIREIADIIGVHFNTILNWRKDPSFNQAVLLRARELLREALPDIYITMAQFARSGSHQHAKLILDHLRDLEDRAAAADQGSVTFTWKVPTAIPVLTPVIDIGSDVASEGGV